MYRYHTVLTKFSIHISPWWTWSHFTKLYFWEALKPREGSPTTLSLGNWSCGLLYVAKTSNQTAIFAVLDATNCQDLSVQWDLPNTERISVGFHGTGNLKKGNAKKALFLHVENLWKNDKTQTSRWNSRVCWMLPKTCGYDLSGHRQVCGDRHFHRQGEQCGRHGHARLGCQKNHPKISSNGIPNCETLGNLRTHNLGGRQVNHPPIPHLDVRYTNMLGKPPPCFLEG